jgi:hypothetical protein
MSNARTEQRAKPVDATIAGDMNWDGEHIDGMSEAGVSLLTGLRPQPGDPVVGRVASAPTRTSRLPQGRRPVYTPR